MPAKISIVPADAEIMATINLPRIGEIKGRPLIKNVAKKAQAAEMATIVRFPPVTKKPTVAAARLAVMETMIALKPNEPSQSIRPVSTAAKPCRARTFRSNLAANSSNFCRISNIILLSAEICKIR